MKTIDRLLESQQARQAVIDLLHATPQGMTGPEIGQHFGWLAGTTGSRLKTMADDGELSRTAEWMLVPNHGHLRKQRTWRYFAAVSTTKQAEDVVRELGKNLTKEGRAEKEGKPARKSRPGHYVHNDADRMAIPNQGGQGASRPRTATYLEVMV